MISNEHRVISRRSALRGLAAGTGATATALWLDPVSYTHLTLPTILRV